jgi:uncharacterized damage-inducible protein DinB
MQMNELEMFLAAWDREAAHTVKVLQALPPTQYDFRPDPGGRSLGELAWHLEVDDAYISFIVERGEFTRTQNRRTSNVRAPSKHWLRDTNESIVRRSLGFATSRPRISIGRFRFSAGR